MSDDTPATSAGGTSAGGVVPQKPVTVVTTGTLIMGTYEIEKLINSGGMGEVYRGRNIHNDELVAIKIVLPSLAHDQKIVALFQKESTVLSRLAHEAIVRYHVFTNDPTIGRPCMVMEFVSGTALADRIEQGPMPLDDVRMMLRRVASGLDKAHRAGVVHRDLSPDNIILEDGLVEHAKLIDFGIAKSTNFGSGTLLQGQFAGKFNWVSPEQLGAYGGQVDGRSDIYSLGLVIAGVSRGQVLPMGASIVDAVSKRASIPDLSGVDPALVPLLRWMLEPDPTNRIESMSKVIAALDNPGLIPAPEALAPPAPDPNRTVIEPLPMTTTAPLSTSARAETGLQPMAQMPGAQAGQWEMPAARQQSFVPDGATVIAPQSPTSPPAPLEDQDVSPFGVAATVASPVMAAPTASKGKGGMLGIAALLAVAAGGAGVYFSGILDGKDPVSPTPAEQAQQEAPATPEAPKAETTPTETDAQAADATKPKAEETPEPTKTEPEAPVVDEAAQTAAKAAGEDVKAKAAEVAAARVEAEGAKAVAEKVAASVAAVTTSADANTLAQGARDAADKAKSSSDTAASALKALMASLEPAKADETATAWLEEASAKATADAQAAADAAKGAADFATTTVDAASKLAEAEAAKAAEEQAAADAAVKADPVARQQAFLDSYASPDCVHVHLASAKAEGFALHGFAVDAKPLETLSADWTKATEAKPDILTHLINEEQCAVLAFANSHGKGETLAVDLAGGADVIKSGNPVEGVIAGVNGRPFTLFLVNGLGGATNLKDHVSISGDGTASFKFRVKLADGLPPEPQLLVAVIADQALTSLMDKVKPGTSTGGLLPFLDKQLTEAGVAPVVGVGFFRLEN